MILKAFREKSNQKYINELLNSRNVTLSNGSIQSVGVIIDSREFSEVEALKLYFNDLGIAISKIQILVFVADEIKNGNLSGTFFSKRDFDWDGGIKPSELQKFLATEFDMFVSFYKEDILELRIVSATAKSNFKVGLSGVDNDLFDFILDVSTKEFNAFKIELKKYLTILKKI